MVILLLKQSKQSLCFALWHVTMFSRVEKAGVGESEARWTSNDKMVVSATCQTLKEGKLPTRDVAEVAQGSLYLWS